MMDQNFIDWATAPRDRSEHFWSLVRKRNTHRKWRDETRYCEQCGGVRLTDNPLCGRCRRKILADRGAPAKQLRQARFTRRIPVAHELEPVYGRLAYRTPAPSPYAGRR